MSHGGPSDLEVKFVEYARRSIYSVAELQEAWAILNETCNFLGFSLGWQRFETYLELCRASGIFNTHRVANIMKGFIKYGSDQGSPDSSGRTKEASDE